jgi:ABC-type multidrug transport system fused ATPase/permease subunit
MNLYLRFLRYAKPYWGMAIAASLCFIISGFLGAYPIQLFMRAVDIAVGDVAGSVSAFYGLAAQYILLLGGLSVYSQLYQAQFEPSGKPKEVSRKVEE